MIHLTKLSGDPFVLNAELIKYVEALPDTFITLTTGEHIVVKETPDEIIHRTVEYHQHKLLIPATANQTLADERNRVV